MYKFNNVDDLHKKLPQSENWFVYMLLKNKKLFSNNISYNDCGKTSEDIPVIQKLKHIYFSVIHDNFLITTILCNTTLIENMILYIYNKKYKGQTHINTIIYRLYLPEDCILHFPRKILRTIKSSTDLISTNANFLEETISIEKEDNILNLSYNYVVNNITGDRSNIKTIVLNNNHSYYDIEHLILSCDNLETLKIYNMSKSLTNDVFKNIYNNCEFLNEIIISECVNINIYILIYLLKLKNIKSIKLIQELLWVSRSDGSNIILESDICNIKCDSIKNLEINSKYMNIELLENIVNKCNNIETIKINEKILFKDNSEETHKVIELNNHKVFFPLNISNISNNVI